MDHLPDYHHEPPTLRCVARLSRASVEALKPGVNFPNTGGEEPVVVFCDPRGHPAHAFKNRCKHNNGRFVCDGGSTHRLRCTNHGWTLDAESLRYTNPPDFLTQEALHLRNEDDGLAMYEEVTALPWNAGRPRNKRDLELGELTVTYLCHASIEIRCADKRVVTDPWYTGPAFGLGWWLAHDPPEDACERAASADLLYISHSHSDHLNVPTLERIARIRPDVEVVLGALTPPIWTREARELGFTNVRVIPLGEWVEMSDDARFMILGDALVPELDTFLLVEHKGHRIVNFVDCGMPNALHLPDDVDVALSDFTSGASGFPAVFTDMFEDDEIERRVRAKRRQFLHKTARQVAAVQPKMWIPVAGYFTEAHPSDLRTRELNRKNTPEEACEFMTERLPGLPTWIPHPGATLDLATLDGDRLPGDRASYMAQSWDFAPYEQAISLSGDFEALDSLAGLQRYFDWAAFRDYDLLLHIIECDDSFEQALREFHVDCLDSRVHQGPPLGDRPVFRMRVRSLFFRHVLRLGLSWDLIYIGFQARYQAVPDVYHFKLMQHFAGGLPTDPLDWDSAPGA